MIIEFIKNNKGLITKIKVDGVEHTLKTPESEHYIKTSKMPNAIELTDGTFLSFKKAGGSAQTTSLIIPEDATFAEATAQANEIWKNFLVDFVRPKISANLLTNIGTSTSRGAYYNSGTNWRDLLPIINDYLTENMTQEMLDFILGFLGETFVLKVVFGDNRTNLASRLSPVFEITELDKEYVFLYENSNEAWNYDLTIELRTTDHTAKFKITHGAKAGDRAKHGTGYGAIRGLWFEEI